jgi:Xaa-Pro aminopeptidase
MSNVSKVQSFLAKANLDAGLFAAPSSITYLTGVRAGPDYDAPWGWAPAACLVPVEGATLVAYPDLFEGTEPSFANVEATFFPSYRIDAYPEPAPALIELLAQNLDGITRLGVEEGALPVRILNGLQQHRSALQVVDITGELEKVRRIKSPEEIERLRAAIALSCAGQQAARESAAPGRSEIEVFADVRSAVEVEVGEPLNDFVVDLVGGARTAQIGGPPGSYELRPGDPVLVDLVFCLNGYWGDTANTFALGEASGDLRRIHQVVWDALRTGRDAIRPGLRARDLDALVRGYIEERGYPVYPHHTGHGLGVAYHEQPIITPWNEIPLESGMILVLEPGIYLDGNVGARLEDAYLVTEDGWEQLSDHDKVL